MRDRHHSRIHLLPIGISSHVISAVSVSTTAVQGSFLCQKNVPVSDLLFFPPALSDLPPQDTPAPDRVSMCHPPSTLRRLALRCLAFLPPPLRSSTSSPPAYTTPFHSDLPPSPNPRKCYTTTLDLYYFRDLVLSPSPLSLSSLSEPLPASPIPLPFPSLPYSPYHGIRYPNPNPNPHSSIHTPFALLFSPSAYPPIRLLIPPPTSQESTPESSPAIPENMSISKILIYLSIYFCKSRVK